MGGSVNIDSRYWGSSDYQEKNIKLNDLLGTLYISDKFPDQKYERIPIGIYPNDKDDKLFKETFSEFKPILKPGHLVELERNIRKGDDEICCTSDIKYYWKDNDNNIFYEPDLDKKLFSCHLDASKIGSTSLCDNIMYNRCVENGDKSQDLEKRCKVWFYELMRKKSFAKDIIDKTNDKMKLKCINNINENYCKDWLNGIRWVQEKEYDSIADNILKQQPLVIKKNLLKCSFPPNYIIKQENKMNTPRECWYRECALSENWKLLRENIRKKDLCQLYDCIINIHDLKTINTAEILITCKNKFKVLNSFEQHKELEEEGEFSMFLLTEYHSVVIMVILLILYIVLKI